MKVEIAIIGGSGFYEITKSSLIGEFFVKTPFGAPSDKIAVFEFQGKKIAFLPRHGKQHQFPPHKINYRANMFALKRLGVERVIATGAAGSLKAEIKPGDFIIPDQLINYTHRKDTFFDGLPASLGGALWAGPTQWPKIFQRVAHISLAQPYCEELRQIAIALAENMGLNSHHKGTVAVIEGPRFSTTAESQLFSQSADIINMTQYPEVALARELSMCYLNIALSTDYDAGLKERNDIAAVSAKQVSETFKASNEKLKDLILEIISNLPKKRYCACSNSLKDAFLS